MQEKPKSLLKNYIFNFLKTFSSLIFPIITFTYSARILGAEGVGQVNFARSVVSYFSMFALMGMNYYGTREAAKRRDNKEELSKFVQEMLMINGVTTGIAYIFLFAAIAFVPKLREYDALLLVSSLAILLQGLGLEWLYQGLEEYKYIAIRSMLFQVGALVALFLFVKNRDDVIPYAIITLMSSYGSYIVNFANARKYLQFRWYGDYEIKKHFKPLLWLFAMAVSIELYTVLDSTMLGFIQGDAVVGRYTAAVKVNKLVITLINVVGVVMIPRLSYFAEKQNQTAVGSLVAKSYNYSFMLSVPAAIGLYMLSEEIILLFSGREFSSAAVTMRILTPIVLVIPFSVATNQYAFIPMGKEKLILKATLIGAVSNFAGNFLLMPRFAENGAAVATVIAETVVAFVSFFNASKFFDMRGIFRYYYQYWIAALPIPLIAVLGRKIHVHYVLRMGIVIILSIGCYFLALFLIKNPYFVEALRSAIRKLKKSKQNPKEENS